MASHQYHEDAIGEPKTDVVKVNLHDIIRERKAERKLKAEEKRQADLQRIRDMKSTIGIDPLQRFPKEIWAKLFDELDPDDRGSVWGIHPLFRDLMEKTRDRDILLPLVLKLILSKFPRLIWPDSHRSYFTSQLRRISKTSRKTFDEFMEDDVNNSIQNHESDSSPYNAHVIFGFSAIREHEELKKTLNSFREGENPAKRFFPRGLSVNISEADMEITGDNSARMDEFKKDITELLRRIGKEMLHFRFFLDDLETVTFSFSEVYILLHCWISLMPNLKWLEVLIQPSSQTIDENVGTSLLVEHPFPRLGHLERLSFHSTFQLGEINIYGVVLEANQHVKMLDLNYGMDWDDDDSTDLPHIPPHLTQSLQLTRFTVCDEEWHSRNECTYLANIQPVMNFNWKLQTIVLSLTSHRADPSIVSVFRFLQHFPTLEKVKLNQLEEFTIGGDTVQLGYLQLPNLKEFYVEMAKPEIDYESNIHFFFTLQFLLHCKELKRLSWKLSGFRDSMKLKGHLETCESKYFGEMIDFRAGMKNLYYSNLWHVFPYLDTIEVLLRKRKEGYENCCYHEYLRSDKDGMSIQKFGKRHWCTRYGYPETCIL